jgi:hypothetical protein
MQKQSEYSGHALGRIPRATILITNSKTVFENQEPLSMKSLTRSQSARRRAAATAALASVGAGILGTHSAEAAIVTIDIGPSGFNIEGVNAGLTSSSFGNISDFPISGGGTLAIYNLEYYLGAVGNGNAGVPGVLFATNGYDLGPFKFSGGATIGASAGTWDGTGNPLFKSGTSFSPNFGADSYLGFRTAQGNYGWMEATWDGTDFQFYSAAYEDVVGQSIVAGATGSVAVPEIDPNGLASALSLVMGSAAMLEQRRRTRAAVAAAAVTA